MAMPKIINFQIDNCGENKVTANFISMILIIDFMIVFIACLIE